MRKPINAKILVVEDELKATELLTKFLANEECEVEVAADGKSALEKVAEFKPECVLLDIRIPQMDGIAVLKKIKSEYPEIEVIMTTAVANFKIVQECLRAGAYTHMVKPLDLANLRKAIKQALHLELDMQDEEKRFAVKRSREAEATADIEARPSSSRENIPESHKDELQALIELLVEKEVLTKKEILEKLRKIKQR